MGSGAISCLMGSGSSQEEDSLKDVYIVIGGPGSRKEYFCRSLTSARGLEYLNFSEAEECTYESDALRASISDSTLDLMQRFLFALRMAIINSRKESILM